MNPDTIKASIQAVTDGLTPLAQKMQIPLQDLFGWAIRHNYAQAAEDFLPLLALLILLPFWLHFLRKADFSRPNIDLDQVGAVLLSSILFVLTIVSCIGVSDGIDRLIAPQWNAAQDIISLIKK